MQKYLVIYSKTKESASYDNLYAKNLKDAKDFIDKNQDVFPNTIDIKPVDTYDISYHELDFIDDGYGTNGTLVSSGNTLDELKENSKIEFIGNNGEEVSPSQAWENISEEDQKKLAIVVEELYTEQHNEINGNGECE